MSRTITSILIWIFYGIMFTVMFIFVLPAFIISFPFDRHRLFPNWVFQTIGKIDVNFNPFWKKHFRGFENIVKGERVILVSNHQSFMDMPFQTLLPVRVKWISKKSLFRIPVMGWNMKLSGHLSVDRNKRASIKSLERQMGPLLEDNIPILIFPEGTRSESGELQPFKSGAFDLAIRHNCYIQPIVLDGTYRMLPSGDWRFRIKEDLYLSIMEKIDPAQFSSRDELKNYAHKVMSDELSRIHSKVEA